MSTETLQQPLEGKKKKGLLRELLASNFRQYAMFIALFVIMIFFNIITDGKFTSPRNLTNLYLQMGYIAVLAVGMVLVIVAGHIDLSVGSVAAFTGAIAAILQVKMGWDTVPTILVALAVGALIGMWQGFWVAYLRVPAFIVTLAGMLIFRGAVMKITDGQTISPFQKSFYDIGSGFLVDIANFSGVHMLSLIIGVVAVLLYCVAEIMKRNSRQKYGFEILPIHYFTGKLIMISALVMAFVASMAFYKGIPYTVLIVVLFVGLYTFLTKKIPVGRYIYAIGGNLEAAKLSGINVKRTLFLVFTSMGTLAALSGVIFSARSNSATPSAGNLFELDAIAAAYIGGASASGGIGSVIGAIIGALVMASINNGMSLKNAGVPEQYIIKGLILLGAVWFDVYTRSKSK